MFEGELELAISAVRAAGQVCKQVYASSMQQTILKKDRSPVTVADYASQAVVCKAVSEAFPDDEIVAEEGADHLRNDPDVLQNVLEFVKQVCAEATRESVCDWIDLGARRGATDRFWTLDPIDGTKGYLRGEQYAVSLALIVNGQVAVGVLCCPNFLFNESGNERGAIFYASKGQGAKLVDMDGNGEPEQIRVSATNEPAQAVFCESFEPAHTAHDVAARVRQLLGIRKQALRIDSQAKYALVAAGLADVYLRTPTVQGYEEKIWDHAAGALVLEEAGGKVTDLAGKPLDFQHGRTLSNNSGIVATNGLLHAPLLDALRRAGEESSR